MQLTVTIHDERLEREKDYLPAETVEYERVSVIKAVGNARVTASILRAIADDIDASPNAKAQVGSGATFDPYFPG